ncbi:MAG: tetratricopeptide repeat protein [Limnothrix sp.]
MRQRTVPYFVGREDELKSLHGFLTDGESVAISAVSGMGGIGKSELALQYIYRYQEDHQGGILWLDGGEDTFAQEIIGFAIAILDLEMPQDVPTQQKVDRVWAHWQGTDPVLVVVDNINKQQDFEAIQSFLPYAARFRVLVTSRVQLARLRDLPLDLLPLEKAVELLERLSQATERKNWDRTAAENLCKRLGRLPLAVSLVGSYLGLDLNLSLAEITAQLEKKGLDARCLDKPDPSVAKRGVKAAFDLSWEHLTAETQRLACVLAMFARAPIEWRLVENTFIPADTDSGESPEFDRFDLTDWRQELLRYSLLQGVELPEQGLSGYQLHPLIWEYLRQKISTVLDEQIRRSMVKAIVTEADTIEYNAPLADYEKVRSSIPHITEVAEEWIADLADNDVITLCKRLAFYYGGFVVYEQAEFWYQKNVDLAKRRLTENHPDIADTLNDLALLYRVQGKYTEAEPLHLEALAIARESLPKNHPSLATSLNNLANLYESQGKYTEAEPLFLEALAIKCESLPKNHPSLATSLNNLANLYRVQGKYTEAEPLYLEALAIKRESLPKNHPSLAISLNNLAELYRTQGKDTEAEPLYLEALAIDRESLPKNHPDLARDLNNLAGLYKAQGKYTEAEPLYLEALAICEESLGLDHPNTRQVRANYERFLEQKGANP